MYLDVLTPLKVLSVSLQQEKHDPVYMLRNVHEFNWLMSKLQLLVENAFEGSTKKLTNYTKFLSLVEQNDAGFVYQDIKLKDFESSKAALEKSFVDMVRKICSVVESTIEDLRRNPIYKNLIPILDIETWPDDADILFTYGESCIDEIVEALEPLLVSNQCNVKNIPNQWLSLKQRVIEIKKSCATKLNYLDLWQKLLVNASVKSQCSDVLHVIELLVITPFTNAKLEQMFSRTNRVKTDFRNQLSRERLENCLRIREEGCYIADYNPDNTIKKRYEGKVRRISSTKPHKYPNKRQRTEGATIDDIIDTARYTLSDFEDSDLSDEEK